MRTYRWLNKVVVLTHAVEAAVIRDVGYPAIPASVNKGHWAVHVYHLPPGGSVHVSVLGPDHADAGSDAERDICRQMLDDIEAILRRD